MNKHQKIGGAVITFGVLLLIAITFVSVIVPRVFRPTAELKLGDGTFKSSIALNDVERAKGLSGKTNMQPDEALIMAYPYEDYWKIWMKDMKIPIDIVWLDKEKKVIYMVKGALPESSTSKTFEPTKKAKYVIEFTAGTLKTNSIDINQIAEYSISESDIR